MPSMYDVINSIVGKDNALKTPFTDICTISADTNYWSDYWCNFSCKIVWLSKFQGSACLHAYLNCGGDISQYFGSISKVGTFSSNFWIHVYHLECRYALERQGWICTSSANTLVKTCSRRPSSAKWTSLWLAQALHQEHNHAQEPGSKESVDIIIECSKWESIHITFLQFHVCTHVHSVCMYSMFIMYCINLH